MPAAGIPAGGWDPSESSKSDARQNPPVGAWCVPGARWAHCLESFRQGGDAKMLRFQDPLVGPGRAHRLWWCGPCGAWAAARAGDSAATPALARPGGGPEPGSWAVSLPLLPVVVRVKPVGV